MAEDDVTPAEPVKPNGGGVKRSGPSVIHPPALRRCKPEVLGVEIGGVVESDGSLPLRISADAITACREAWAAACRVHEDALAKVSALNPEPAAQLRSRRFFFDAKQRSLRAADAALGEIRLEQKAVEEKIRRATVPSRAPSDFSGATLAAEIRGFLRGLNESDRLATIERAIAGDNVAIVAAALEQPALANLTKERADLIAGRWRRVRCPDELRRLEVLEQTAAKVQQAAERLEQRFAEAYSHGTLDALERQQANSNQAA